MINDKVEHFGREHSKRHRLQLKTHRIGKFLDVLGHSILGLVDVYNLLLADIVQADDVSTFQRRLQEKMIDAAKNGAPQWQQLYSPRFAIYAHPLRGGLHAANGNSVIETIVQDSNAKKCVKGWLAFGQ